MSVSSSTEGGIIAHSNCLIGDELWYWGGHRPDLPHDHDSPEKRQFTSTIDVLDLSTSTFCKHQTTGAPPCGTLRYSCCNIGIDIYYFGGSCVWDRCFHDNLFVFNSKSHEWREIECDGNGPMKKHGCGMIPIGDHHVLIIGGYGPSPSNLQPHTKYVPTPHSPSWCYTNEVHIMCVSSIPGKWIVPTTTGSMFPPLAFFSINTFPGNRAIVFGGRSVKEHNKLTYDLNDVFILTYTNNTIDFMTLEPNPSVQWPTGRSFHSSVTITSVSSTGVEKHHLVVLGRAFGLAEFNYNPWILDIEKRQWEQIGLPSVVTKRDDHSMSCYKVAVNCVWLIITGGRIGWRAGYFISTADRLMIVELVYSRDDDIWTVFNVFDERDIMNKDKYSKLLSEAKSNVDQRLSDVGESLAEKWSY